jgi:pimeloyl-ACP methyl ester carboxylesterase
VDQQIQYCAAPDGTRLAYAVIGKGPLLVRTSHWFTHIEHDLTSPVFRHTILGLAHSHKLLRYDARGIGLSQRDAEITFDKWVQDLETVIDAAGFDKFILLGLSQGCAQAAAYAARHPDRVSHLILFGGFARGVLKRDGDPAKAQEGLDLTRALIRQGWGSDDESHRQFFTSQFMPDASRELHHALNQLQQQATTPDIAERFLMVNATVDVRDLLGQIKAPTLVLHSIRDTRVPFALGQEFAAGIPGAKLVPLDSRNHMIPPEDPAHRQMSDAIADFLGEKRIRHLPATTHLGARLEKKAQAKEQNWFIKFVRVFAAITGCLIFFWEVYKLVRGAH